MTAANSSCSMIVMALSGLSGETVWETRVEYDAFAVRCEVDLNNDDVVDCIATGRQSGFRALNGMDGSVLWDRDQRTAYLRYNFYFPLIVPDLDGDGVRDLINTHGGDATYSGEDKERSPSFLVALSGRTGQQLMERVPMPDGHETYMSPVLFSWGEVGQVVLVGTGGETLPGSLWAISFDSLRQRIASFLQQHTEEVKHYQPFREYINHPCAEDMNDKEMEAQRPVFDKEAFKVDRPFQQDKEVKCPTWGQFHPIWNRYGLCVYRLVETEEKGVILPPVVVDMTGDGQEDLVVSCFDGRVLVMDGKDGSTVWEVETPGAESYRWAVLTYYCIGGGLFLCSANYFNFHSYSQSSESLHSPVLTLCSI